MKINNFEIINILLHNFAGNKKTLTVFRQGFWIVLPNDQFRLSELNIDRIQAFFAFFCFESDNVSFANFVNQSADMNENFFVGGWVDNKTKAFGFIEELDSSFLHTKKIVKMKSNCPEGQGKGTQNS